jgi:hypothetical protein
MPESLNDFYAFRDRLAERLEVELVGPVAPDEILDEAPITRYACGVLFPQATDPERQAVDLEADIDVADEDPEAGPDDTPVAMANSRYPSSLGVTFAVDPNSESEIKVEVTAGWYESNTGADGVDAATVRWFRRPIRWSHTLACTPGTGRFQVERGLELYAHVREPDETAHSAVTLALINTREADGISRDGDSFFQPMIRVAPGAADSRFVERRRATTSAVSDRELMSYRLLYRHAKTYAVGHGCSVTWSEDHAGASSIWTTFAPTHELRLADSNDDIDSSVLSIRTLTSGEKSDVLAELERFCVEYRDWIDDCRSSVAALSDAELRTTANEHLVGCEAACSRMLDGVANLGQDPVAWQAFRHANRAMLEQRARTDWLRMGAPAPGPDPDVDLRWRPFQLAFILQCLRGITCPEHEDRLIADLLWFPTGGGKTEAYLGLIAFTVFYRRLRDGHEGAGVTVLMRYTLRLLTIQQFERAALLMCACETIRRGEPALGSDPISIGLWIGRAGAPNKLDDARAALDKLRARLPVEEGNPVQLQRCPWCGHPLDAFNYVIETSPRSMSIRCPRPGCDFGDGLPVRIIDEDVYRAKPSLIIATADKFAQLPWNADVGSIFNRGTTFRPPELIVQDELHLISGPLGTLAGLYETAVDLLCTDDDGHRPKVVASTATIRRADEQTRGLFARGMRQFPPPALDARDSYFSVEREAEAKGTRRYVGLMASSSSHATLMIRSYAALLQSAASQQAADAVKDPYWTLVGYFNSLRVLAGARMQVQDDVGEYMRVVAGVEPTRTIDERIELTSREASSDIPRRLDQMAISYPDDEALDVVLATNMISVGVDVNRLGLMVVMGQPQSTSEYIQATSRVGRSSPGLVITLFNANKSRDRSHFESFVGYHSALYRQVESTSVTPFSPRARDRGLHAVLVALARQMVPGLQSNQSAKDVSRFREGVEGAAAKIVDRVRSVEPDQVGAVEKELAELIEEWVMRATSEGKLFFNQPFRPNESLLVSADRGSDADPGSFPTLYSLRDVDSESNLFLVSG